MRIRLIGLEDEKYIKMMEKDQSSWIKESTIGKVKKPAKIHSLVNWFFGNYCTRKCYEEDDKTICDLSDEEWRKRFSWKRSDCVMCRMMGMRF
mgnify:CR=1 FL=1